MCPNLDTSPRERPRGAGGRLPRHPPAHRPLQRRGRPPEQHHLDHTNVSPGPDAGKRRLRPAASISEDLAKLAVEAAQGNDNTEVDAVGPEIYSYKYLLRTIRARTGARCLILPAPKWLAYAAARVLGFLLRDIVITKDEIKGLERNLLVSRSPVLPPCPTRLSEWLNHNGERLGTTYANELSRHYE